MSEPVPPAPDDVPDEPAAPDEAAEVDGSAASDESDVPDEVGEIVVPDDLSGLMAQETPSVALVVTQVAVADPLAAACALAGVDVDAVPSQVGAIAVLRDPAAALAGAAAISKLLRTLPVVLLERREGQISASRWIGGTRDDDLPPGLVLADSPALLEDLLLGETAAASAPGSVTSVGMSRWKAMRTLAQGRRR
ncbi:hypothetical protein [Cellulomonas composti]|uniref:Uncharacterized protein n=1 Tax=Cellulomonas composti TaxID=266130 RepID=A0A511J905_9CELL|nr:hypothetical protein [Cellulomonas composti]GEL94219.1 hypothetical protein CCO02nite_08770 [Cellulomonas composti]